MKTGIRHRSAILAVCLAAFLGSLLFTKTGLQGLLMSVLFLICLTPTLVSLYRGRFDIFEPIVFHSLFMFMTSIAIFDRVYLSDPYLLYPEWVQWNSSTAFLILTVLYVVFYTFVLAGYYVKIERWMMIPEIPSQVDDLSGNTLKKLGLLYVFIGMVCYVLLIKESLSWDLLYLYSTAEPRSQIFDSTTHFMLGSRAVYVGYLVWLTGTLLDGRRTGIVHLLPILPILFLFLLLGGRGQVLLIVLVTATILYYVHIFEIFETKPRYIRILSDNLHDYIKLAFLPLSGIVLGFMTVFAGLARSWRDTDNLFNPDLLVQMATFGIHNSHLDNLLVTLSIIPEDSGFFWGTFILRVPLNYIPRSIWSDKPVLTSGSLLRRLFLPDGTGGRPPGMIGRFFLDGGPVAILLGALLFGLILRLLYLLLRRNRHSPIFLLFYAFIFSSIATQGFLNGSLWMISNHLLLLSPLLVLGYIESSLDE
ncbi:oligosaccharide repeat unit polymerase [Natronoarchaeum rubrum]|uniref:oligosaccharide repeat unit polymerase n=1 Tax=Natronoarchaeum rubrum TaxID=755311 RepID=UPI0021120D36|nr:oligosaccharide repeat unit polymerase [Natronoarchaeum rubrum]